MNLVFIIIIVVRIITITTTVKAVRITSEFTFIISCAWREMKDLEHIFCLYLYLQHFE